MSTAHNVSGPSGAPAPQGVALSREELLVVLRLLKANSIPGFDAIWAHEPDSSTLLPSARDALAVATRALVARGYLNLQEAAPAARVTRVEVAAPVLALVGACAQSAFNCRVAVVAGGEYQVCYLHELHGLGVLHASSSPDIHVFVPVNGRRGVVEMATDVTAMPQRSHADNSLGSIPSAPFKAAARATFQEKPAFGPSALDGSTVPPPLRDALAHALAAPKRLGEIAVRANTAPQATLYFLAAAEQSYLFLPSTTGQHMLEVYLGSAQRVKDWLTPRL